MPYAAAPMVLKVLAGLVTIAFLLAMIACVIEITVSDWRARRENRQRWQNFTRTGRYKL